LLWTAQASVQLQLLYPDLAKIASRALASKAYPQKFWAHALDETNKFFLHLVAIGKEQGDIAPEINDDLAAFIFSSVFANLGQYIAPYILKNEAIQHDGKIFWTPEAMTLFEQTLSILEHGLGRSKPVEEDGYRSETQSNGQEANR